MSLGRRLSLDAIRAYSAEFPRAVRRTLELVAGVHEYALPESQALLAVLRVEYSAQSQNAIFLVPVDPADPAASEPWAYSLLPPLVDDDLAAGGRIRLGAAVQSGEQAQLHLLTVHPTPDPGDDSAVLTVPLAHWEALIAFVDFRCHWELEVDEAYTTVGVALTLSMLGENGRRAWNRWREIMDRLHRRGVQQDVGASRLVWGDVGL